MHLGASVGAPVVALFGPTDPAIWCPAARGVYTMRAPGHDLGNLPAVEVEAAVLGFADHLGGDAPLPEALTPAPTRPA